MSEYSDLKSKVISFAESSTDVVDNTVMDYLLENAQQRIAREIDLDFLRKTEELSFKAEDPYKKLPLNTAVLRHVHFLDGQNRVFLENRDLSYCIEYNSNRTITGKPKYYAKYDQNTLYIAPTPSTNYTIEIGYTVKPTADEPETLLSSSSPYSWISKNAANILFYATMAELLVFLKGPQEMLQVYEGKYQGAMQSLGVEQQGRNRTDEYKLGIPRTPVKGGKTPRNV